MFHTLTTGSFEKAAKGKSEIAYNINIEVDNALKF